MNDDLAARAELYLCLSQAFLAPSTAQRAQAVRSLLADDLQELDERVALQAEGAVADLREQLRRVDSDLALLQIYSAIFLAPPVAGFINAGQYLDGAPDGGSVRVLEEAYRRCGMARDDGFRDLSDHVSVVLEFVGWLYAQQAVGEPVAIEPGHFLHSCVAPWVERFAADVARAGGGKALPANPYRGLAAILQIAVLRDLVAPEVDPQALRHERALQRARAMRAGRGITAEDLEEIRQKLQARGLSADHLPASVQEADRRVAAALGAA
jgi:TorA maturation chaperone TorD